MNRVVGIYRILSDGKTLYIGQSRDVGHRISTHKSELKYNRHPNIILQRMHNKGHTMVFEVVESDINIEDLTPREIYFINILKPVCNIAIPASDDSWTFTEERNRKVSIGNIGKPKSESHKLNISLGRKEAIMNNPGAYIYLKTPWNKGNGTYMAGEKNHFYGKRHTEETKKIISQKKIRYNIDINEIIKLRSMGHSFEKISRLLGGTRKVISKRYHKHEIDNNRDSS